MNILRNLYLCTGYKSIITAADGFSVSLLIIQVISPSATTATRVLVDVRYTLQTHAFTSTNCATPTQIAVVIQLKYSIFKDAQTTRLIEEIPASKNYVKVPMKRFKYYFYLLRAVLTCRKTCHASVRCENAVVLHRNVPRVEIMAEIFPV